MRGVSADLANAWRIARRRAGFSLAVIFTLALGIGANTAVFSLVHAVVLSPLPYARSDGLFMVFERHGSGRRRLPSYPTFRDWSERADVFEGLAFVRGAALTYQTEGHSGFLLGSFVTEGFFDLLGVPAELGRVLTAEDHRPGSEGAVLLSHRAWERWFGADPDVLGTVLVADGAAFTVVGVMPPSFAFPDWGVDNDLWMPISHLPPSGQAALNQREFRADSRVVARVRSDIPLAEVQRGVDRVAASLASAYPDSNAGWTTAELVSLKTFEVGGVRARILMLWAAVLLVLLMCCLNLSNLYLVQGSSRRQEYAVRTALGAPRWRIVQQVLTETLALTLVGGALGVVLAQQAVAWARSGGLTDLPRITELGLDGSVLAFAASLCFMTAAIFALLSTRQVRSVSLHQQVRGSGRGSTRTASMLAVIQATQVGMTFALVLAAWLLGETFVKLTRVDPGYEPRNLLVVPIHPPSPAYDEEPAALGLYTQLLDAVRAVPGVVSVVLTNHGPGGLAGAPTQAAVGGMPQNDDEGLSVYYRTISAGYFATVNTPLVAGREFTQEDLLGGEGPVIVNETLAARLGGGAAAVGRTIGVRKAASSRADYGEPFLGTVVGVVADLDVSETGGNALPIVYVPFTQSPWGQVRLLVRTSAASAAMIRAVEDAVRSLEPGIPLSGPFVSVRRLEDLRSTARAQERLNAGLVGAFAAIALLLACVGMYGVISFIVTLRTREMGVRMAVGAAPRQIAVRIVRQAALIGAGGLVGGLAAAAVLSSFMRSLLFEVSPLEAGRYAVVAGSLLAMAVLAAYVPARRASRLDPALVLRSE